MKRIRILAIVTPITLTSCASFIQTENADKDRINTGISYYLPKREHRLVITAENLDAKKEAEKLENAQKLFDEKNKLAKELEVEWKELSSVADKTPVDKYGADAKAEAVKKAQTSTGFYLAAKDVADIAKQALEVAKSRYDQANALTNEDANRCNYYITMNITPQPLQPDTKYPFLLKLNSSPLRDEDLKIKTTSSGLLSSADAISTDRTLDSVVEIAKAVAMLGFGFPSGPISDRGIASTPAFEKLYDDGKKPECYSILKFDEILDFAALDDIRLRDSSGLPVPEGETVPELKVSIEAPIRTSLIDTQDTLANFKAQEIPSILKGHYGILYRRDVTYLVKLTNDDKTIITQQILMPNLSPVSLLPYKYRPFVSTKNNAIFENGMLVFYDTNQPSSVLALAKLPATVIEGYINAITNFLQLKIDYSTKEIAAIGKEKELADLLKSLQGASKQQYP